MAATDNVEKGIRRGDADVSLQALSRLAPLERGPFLEPVGTLFRAAVQSDHRAKNWSKLIAWASRAEKVPGIEGSPGSADFLSTGWTLTWAAIKTRDWPRARRWYEPIHPALLERSPAFAAVMATVVAERATPGDVEPFLLADSAPDPRLGQEKKRVRLEWTAPRSVDEVERALLAMAAIEPWAVFATNVTVWTAQVDAATRAAMLELAAKLATRETVKRMASKRGSPGEPAELLRWTVDTLQSPASLADDTLLMFRLLASRVSQQSGSTATSVRELAHGALAASRYESLRPMVVAFVTSLEVPGDASSLIRVLEHLLEQRPELALVGKAWLWLADAGPSRGEAHRASPTLVKALSTVISTDREGLARWFDELQGPTRNNLAQCMSFVLPVEVAQSFILATWGGASKPTRADLVTAVENVILRLQDSVRVDDLDFDDLLDFEDPLSRPLPPRARPFWNAVRDLVLPEALEFLPFAVREARGENPTKMVDQALGDKPTIQKMLQAWALLWDDEHSVLCRQVEAGIFTRYGEKLHELIHGVVEAHRIGLPLALQRKLAQALHDQRAGKCDCPDFKHALELADGLLKPRRAKAKKSNKKKKGGQGDPPPDDGSIPF